MLIFFTMQLLFLRVGLEFAEGEVFAVAVLLELRAQDGGALGRDHFEVDVAVFGVGVLADVADGFGCLERLRCGGRGGAVGAAVVGAGDGLVDGERFDSGGIGLRVEAVEGPVAGFDGAPLLHDGVAEAGTDAVVDAGAVGYDYGGAGIVFGFRERVDGLLVVGSERDGCYVDVAVGHHHAAKIFLGGRFAVGGIFCHA